NGQFMLRSGSEWPYRRHRMNERRSTGGSRGKTRMTLRRNLFAFALASAAISAQPALADTRFTAEYVLTVRGVTVAKASFSGSVTGDRYAVDGKLASSGLGRVVGKMDATAHSTGVFNQATPSPESFKLSYVQDGQA